MAVDAYYSKKSFVPGVLEASLDVVGKRRAGANLQLFNKAPYSGKGSPKQFAGKVEMDQAEQLFERLGEIEPGSLSDYAF